jgi:hypothetical protein
MAKVSVDATAFAHGDDEAILIAAMPLHVDANVRPGQRRPRQIGPARRARYRFLRQFLSSGSPADIATVYPDATYRRLAAVKRRYDPHKAFHPNHNIALRGRRGGTPRPPPPLTSAAEPSRVDRHVRQRCAAPRLCRAARNTQAPGPA